MPTTYSYTDPYLAPLVTGDRETRAVADVAGLGEFPAYWTERLVRLRCYILVCQESQKAPGDLFAEKLATYSKEFRDVLPLARAAQDAAETGGAGIFASIPLLRA